MKPLYIDYSGSDAPMWAPFARKKMKQYAEQLELVGLPFGRKHLKFDNVSISFYMSPLFAKLRIETGAAPTFFGLYNVNLSGTSYQYLAAFDDEGGEQWRLSLGSHATFSGFQRSVLGCSASGEKVLLLERDTSTFLRIKEVTNGSITSTAEYDIGATGYTDTFASTLPRVSLDGTRALFPGPVLNMIGTERAVFLYDKTLDPQIRAVEVALEWSTNHDFTLLGAADLSVMYCAFHSYRVTDAGAQPSVFITKLSRVEGVGEVPPTIQTESLEVVTAPGLSHYVFVNDVACGPDGAIAVGYSTLTPPTFSAESDSIYYVQTASGDIEVAQQLAAFPTEGSLTSSPRVFSVSPGATTFAFRVFSDGIVKAGVVSTVPETVLAVDASGSMVLADGSKYIVRRAEGDFDLVDDPYSGGAVLHAIAGNGDIYAEFNPLIQPTLERLVRKWVPETDPDTGDVTGYPTMQEIGDTPLSITVTPVDPEVEETATLSGKILNVYVQRVVQS